MLLARSRHASVRSLERYARPDPRPSHATSPPPTQPPGVGVHNRLRDATSYEVAHSGQTRYLTVILIVVFALDGAASPFSSRGRSPAVPVCQTMMSIALPCGGPGLDTNNGTASGVTVRGSETAGLPPLAVPMQEGP
jgi:hypothetical protein